jgi:ribosome maturation factor RimP
MNKQELASKIHDLLVPITQANGAELVRVKLIGHTHRPTVQIMAERPDATMDLGLCETLSKEYSLLLDVHDIIPTEYVLEVSSPGIDRPLTREKDFINWSGFEASIELAEKLSGRKRFKGLLLEPVSDADSLIVKIQEDKIVHDIPFALIKEAQLILTDSLLKATQNGAALHGFPCDDPDVEQKATLQLTQEEKEFQKQNKNASS